MKRSVAVPESASHALFTSFAASVSRSASVGKSGATIATPPAVVGTDNRVGPFIDCPLIAEPFGNKRHAASLTAPLARFASLLERDLLVRACAHKRLQTVDCF